MYNALDSFLRVDTWHTGHRLDLVRFNLALAEIVRDPSFNADEMANYMYALKGISNTSEHPLAQAIERRRSAACAVRAFLEDNGLLDG